MVPYRTVVSHSDGLIGSRIHAFDWYQNHRHWMTYSQNALCCRKDAYFGAHCTNLNEFEYYQRQKCRPMSLVFGNVRCIWIFAGVPLGGGIKWEWVCRWRQFLAIWVMATSSETSDIQLPLIRYCSLIVDVGQIFVMAISFHKSKW